jgi:hypothetical protein
MVKLSEWKTIQQVIDERIAADPAFAQEWARTAPEREREIDELRSQTAEAFVAQPDRAAGF